MAGDLDVGLSTAGSLVTVFAVTVVIATTRSQCLQGVTPEQAVRPASENAGTDENLVARGGGSEDVCRMLHTASSRIRNLAAALQTTAFNVGIGGGALLGGVLLDGAGIRLLPIVE